MNRRTGNVVVLRPNLDAAESKTDALRRIIAEVPQDQLMALGFATPPWTPRSSSSCCACSGHTSASNGR